MLLSPHITMATLLSVDKVFTLGLFIIFAYFRNVSFLTNLFSFISLMSTGQPDFLLSFLLWLYPQLFFSDISDLVRWFNSVCSLVLDRIAQLKVRLASVISSSPWISDHISHHRRQCRMNLHVHYLHTKELLITLIQLMSVRTSYFAN